MRYCPCTLVGMPLHPEIGSQAWQQSRRSSSTRIGVCKQSAPGLDTMQSGRSSLTFEKGTSTKVHQGELLTSGLAHAGPGAALHMPCQGFQLQPGLPVRMDRAQLQHHQQPHQVDPHSTTSVSLNCTTSLNTPSPATANDSASIFASLRRQVEGKHWDAIDAGHRSSSRHGKDLADDSPSLK